MNNLAPADRAALEIGRMFMRAHAAEQQAEIIAQRLAETEARLAEFTNGLGEPEKAPVKKAPARRKTS